MITGAARGLGYCLTEEYAVNGCNVFACARDINSGKLLALREKYPDSVNLTNMDVSRTESVEKAAAEVGKTAQSLDIIINNAGMHFEDSGNPLEDVNIDHCLETYNINSLGALRVAKYLASFLAADGNGSIINISSDAGSISGCTMDSWFDYCMSKAALNMESKLLHNYLSKRNIRVLAIHPGWMRTGIGGPDSNIDPEDSAKYIIRLIDSHKDTDGIYFDYLGNAMDF